MSNIGKRITDFYCNGFFGRRYDLCDFVILSEYDDTIVIYNPETEEKLMTMFEKGWQLRDKQQLIDEWTI